MTKLLIVRHGEASASWEESTDPGLSDLGIVQAEECANMLIKLEGIENYDLKSSPLKRAIETGTKLKEKLNKDLFIDPVFTEIPSPGIPLNKRQQWLNEIFNKNLVVEFSKITLILVLVYFVFGIAVSLSGILNLFFSLLLIPVVIFVSLSLLNFEYINIAKRR